MKEQIYVTGCGPQLPDADPDGKAELIEAIQTYTGNVNRKMQSTLGKHLLALAAARAPRHSDYPTVEERSHKRDSTPLPTGPRSVIQNP